MSQPGDLHLDARAIETLIERWFFETFHGSAAARSTETWNLVHGAKEDLKRRLAAVQPNLRSVPDVTKPGAAS